MDCGSLSKAAFAVKSKMSPIEVLKRYKSEDLPEFAEVDLTNVNQEGNFGNRPLNIASVRGEAEEVEALLAGGADCRATGELGNTALHEAVGQCHFHIVKMLLRAGASPIAKNDHGDTPIDIAVLKNRTDILIELRRYAASTK
jgi:ankyrin repeat protein